MATHEDAGGKRTATTDEAAGKRLVKALEDRFTCKRYDPNGHVSDEDFGMILEAARLSPSSFGFEPWKLLVIEDKELVEEVRAQAWGAKRNADRTVVILARRGVDAESAWARHISSDVQGLSDEDVTAKLEKFAGFQRDEIRVAESARTLFDWAGKQTYIALANMLTMAAVLGVDATPVEGFNLNKLEELLVGRGLYNPNEWGVSVLAQFGVHDPTHRMAPKTRRPLDQVVEWVK